MKYVIAIKLALRMGHRVTFIMASVIVKLVSQEALVIHVLTAIMVFQIQDVKVSFQISYSL